MNSPVPLNPGDYPNSPSVPKYPVHHYPMSTPEYRPDVPLWAQQLQWRLDQVQLSLYRIEERLKSNPRISEPSLHERKDQPSADSEDTTPQLSQ